MKRYMIILIFLIGVLTLNGCYSKQNSQTNLPHGLPNEQNLTDTLYLTDLHMVDKLNGWVISNKSVLKTEDGGNTVFVKLVVAKLLNLNGVSV